MQDTISLQQRKPPGIFPSGACGVVASAGPRGSTLAHGFGWSQVRSYDYAGQRQLGCYFAGQPGMMTNLLA
jgi:hypothetical protein